MWTWPIKSNVFWTLSIIKFFMCLRAVKCNVMWVLYCCGSVWMTVLPFFVSVTLKQLVFRKQWGIQECCQKRKFWDTKLYALFIYFFIVLFKNVVLPLISTNILFKLILRNSVFGKLGLCRFGFLCSVDWYLIMEVSGQPISPIFMGKELEVSSWSTWRLKMVPGICLETSVNNYQPTLHKNGEEWRPQCIFQLI